MLPAPTNTSVTSLKTSLLAVEARSSVSGQADIGSSYKTLSGMRFLVGERPRRKGVASPGVTAQDIWRVGRRYQTIVNREKRNGSYTLSVRDKDGRSRRLMQWGTLHQRDKTAQAEHKLFCLSGDKWHASIYSQVQSVRLNGSSYCKLFQLVDESL